MKINFQRLVGLLTGRVAMNLYFWALIIVPRIDFDAPAWQDLFSALLYGLLMTLMYFNNLVLAPKFLITKNYRSYFISVFAASFLVAFCYTFVLKLMLHYHPGTPINMVSLIVGGQPELTPDLSMSAVFYQVIKYYIPLLSFALIFTLAWYMRDYFRQQKVTEELKKKQMETELLFLKGQINPHFLFNTLNNLYGLSMENSDQTSDAILKLSSIMRYLLYESNAARVSFEKEKEVMLAYIDLELLRLVQKDNLHFSISADTSVSIPPLLWLPVLENVFKHGTRFIDNDYRIEYHFSVQNDRLTIYSKNKFKANAQNEPGQSTGIGLRNLKQRLEILYPGKYTMETTHDEAYYMVKVDIALK